LNCSLKLLASNFGHSFVPNYCEMVIRVEVGSLARNFTHAAAVSADCWDVLTDAIELRATKPSIDRGMNSEGFGASPGRQCEPVTAGRKISEGTPYLGFCPKDIINNI
jgi:hypothetical protein